jgi:hypothetical protein
MSSRSMTGQERQLSAIDHRAYWLAACLIVLFGLLPDEVRAQSPGRPQNVGVVVQGFVVTLRWDPPVPSTAVTSYVIEVGSRSGASDLLVFDTASNARVFRATAPAGTYYVRLRATNGGLVGLPSLQVIVRVPGPDACTTVPLSVFLDYEITGNVVTFDWPGTPMFTGRVPASFVFEVGTSVGVTNITRLGLATTGQPGQRFSVVAPPGFYYVRVRGRNACGVGGPSNDVLVVVDAGNASLSGRWSGAAAVGSILWVLELDLRQQGTSVTGTYYFRAEDALTLNNESWGVAVGTRDAGGALHLTLSSRGPAPLTPNPGGTFSGGIGANVSVIDGVLAPLPASGIPLHRPRILLQRR